jgi:hypothetical protein
MIEKKEYKFKIRAIILFEKKAGKAWFKMESLTDSYLWFYCVYLVNDASYSKSFEEFCDECDENPELFKDFSRQMEEWSQRQANLSDSE